MKKPKKELTRLLKPNNAVLYVAMLVFCIVTFFLKQFVLAAAELVLWLIIVLIGIGHWKRRRVKIKEFIQAECAEMVGTKGAQVPFPAVVIRMEDGGIVHANDAFVTLTGYHDVFNEHSIEEFFPAYKNDWLLAGKAECPADVRVGAKRFRMYGSVLRAEDTGGIKLAILYLVDLTEMFRVYDEYIRSRPVVSVILIDNYEEITKNVSEASSSALDAQLYDTVLNWVEQYHGLLRRLEKNRFLMIFEKRDLQHAREMGFSVLEDIKCIKSHTGLEATISMGLGVDGATFSESYDFAAAAVSAALDRGGDQAVVKDRVRYHFYGGRKQEPDQRDPVRSRVVANGLLDMINQSSRVYIMGHRNADLDSLGAAMGVACLCRLRNKPFYIVLDRKNNACGKLLKLINQVPEYESVIVSGTSAHIDWDSRSALVIVDTNRPGQVEYVPLLESATNICVIDHHLRAEDYISKAALTLHETSASSACELVTEILRYTVNSKDIKPIEALSLMAGIYLDTKNFNVRTGERTFAAATYLRRLGVDTIDVKMLFQNEYDATCIRHQIVESAEIFAYDTAIAMYSGQATRPLAAQAADEMLNIAGITTSFVLYSDGESVIVSARSIRDTNVQVILEPFGGGGNPAAAGAQIKGMSLQEVKEALKAEIKRFHAK